MDKPSNWSRINKRANGRGTGWTDEETKALILLYFEMVSLQKAGRLARATKANPNNVSKSSLVKAFMAQTGRTKGSIETKLMNISASMRALGLPIVSGYKPLSNRSVGLDAAVKAQSLICFWID
jgi:5-methylcytosine-specific restriction protein A